MADAEVVEPLTDAERRDLESLYSSFDSWSQHTIRFAVQLLDARDRRLYRETDATFRDFCRRRFGLSQMRAIQLVQAGNVMDQIETERKGRIEAGVDDEDELAKLKELKLPVRESHAAAIAKLPEEQRLDFWLDATERFDADPTARAIEELAAVWAADNEPYEEKEDGPVILDGRKQQVPVGLVHVFASRPRFKSLRLQLGRVLKEIHEIADLDEGRFVEFTNVQKDIENARNALKFAMPHAPCPYCQGNGCDNCRDSGYVPESVWKQVPEEVKDKLEN